VALHAGDQYSIVVSQLNSEGDTTTLPVESKMSDSDVITISAGESFLSGDGTNWTDLASFYSAAEITDGGNTCIKGLTTEATPEIASILTAPTATQIAGFPINVSTGALLLSYDDGTKETVAMNSPWVSITGYDNAKLGAQTLEVDFDGVNAGTINVNVIPAASAVSATLNSGSKVPKMYQYDANSSKHTISLAAKVTPAGALQDVTWAATGPASISSAGLVTFTGEEGNVTVTATTTDGTKINATYTIAVARHVTKITSAASTLYMKKNSTLTPVIVTLDGIKKVSSKLTYKSSNTKVLSVNSSGKFTAKKVKKKTKVTVTIKAANGASKKLTVYVVPKASKVESITVSGSPKTLKIGKLKQLTVRLNPTSATNVKPAFRSSKSSVVSVDSSGNIRALKKGTAIITVKAAGKTVKTKEIKVS
jgi:hypothetical protein